MSLTFIEVAAIVGGLVALLSIGVSIGVYVTKIPAMQKQIDEDRADARKHRDWTLSKFEKHDEAIGDIEKSIVGINHNVQTLLESSRANGVKLDRLFGLLADRAPN